MNTKKQIIYRISICAIMIGLIFLVTRFLAIPYPGGGYFNFGDSLILFTSIFVGPIEGIIAGVCGSVLGDLTSGYANFIPFTIVAKSLESIIAFIIYKLLKKHRHLKYLSLFIGSAFMCLTYFVSYIILYDINYALTQVIFDVIQALVSSTIAYFLLKAFEKTNFNLNKKSE
jgi:Predicted membrane protein